MAIENWLFADDEARLAQARVALAERRFDDARALVSGVAGDEAELIRDELISHYDDEPEPGEPPIDPAERTLDTDHLSITEACPLLKPQLFATSIAAADFEPSEVLSYAPAEGLAAVLMYDLGYRSVPVAAKTAFMWGPTEAQLFNFATKNIVVSEETEVLDVTWEGEFLCDMVSGPRPFVGALALAAHDVLHEAVEHAIVSIPRQTCFLYRGLRDPDDQRLIEPFCAFASTLHRDADAPVSPNVYWWRRDSWTLLPYTHANGSVILEPPKGFGQMLADLGKDDD